MAISLAAVSLAAVHVDPDGPAGKEYALPVEEARVEAGGGNEAAAVPGSGIEAPLFGVGVTPAERAGPGAGASESASDANLAASADGEGAATRLGVTAILVIALGGGAGLGMRALARA